MGDMMRSTVFLLLALFVISIESQPRRRKIGLRELLRSKVVYAEFVARKARSGKGFDHYGVVITTERGGRWLVHKGFNFSRLSHTVVTSASHMSKRWGVVRKGKVRNAVVTDFIKAGGKFFHPFYDNAFHAATRMMKLTKKE